MELSHGHGIWELNGIPSPQLLVQPPLIVIREKEKEKRIQDEGGQA